MYFFFSFNFGFYITFICIYRVIIIFILFFSKVLALDTRTSEVIWSIFLPFFSPFANGNALLFTQRTSAHYPNSPQCIAVGRHKVSTVFFKLLMGWWVFFDPVMEFCYKSTWKYAACTVSWYPILPSNHLTVRSEFIWPDWDVGTIQLFWAIRMG